MKTKKEQSLYPVWFVLPSLIIFCIFFFAFGFGFKELK